MSDKYREANNTQFPNILIDEKMRELSGNGFKVLAVIVRSTIGRHKTRERVSQSQIMEKTGLSRNTVKKALNELVKQQLVTATAAHTSRIGALYDLNIAPETTPHR